MEKFIIVILHFVLLTKVLLATSLSTTSLTASFRESTIEVRWTNDSSSSILLNLGQMMGDHPLYAVRLLVSGSGISSGPQPLQIGNDSGVIEGRIDPWVVVLPPQAEYILRFPLNSLRLKDGRNLEILRASHWTVTILFTGHDGYDQAPGGKKVRYSITENGPTIIPFWHGSTKVEISR